MKNRRRRQPKRASPKRRGRSGSARSATTSRRTPGKGAPDALLAPIASADHREVGAVKIDIVQAANGRIKRVIYPPGFRWSTHMKAAVGTDLCMHAHVGFLARGRVRGQYADGCAFEHRAPRVLVVEPGHDAWVVGDEPAVLIQFDAEGGTAERFGLPEQHRH